MAGECGRVPKVLPAILDRVPELAAEVGSMITALYMQLANLGRWVDRQRRVDGSLFCGSLVPEFTGPQTLGDLLVPATPNVAQILSLLVLFGDRVGKPSDQDGKQRKLDDAAVADSEIKSHGEDVAKAEGAQEVTDTTRICFFFFFGQCRIA